MMRWPWSRRPGETYDVDVRHGGTVTDPIAFTESLRPYTDHHGSVFTQTSPDDGWHILGGTDEHGQQYTPQEQPTAEGAPVSTEATHRADEAEIPTEVRDTRPDCPACHGTGKQLTTRDYLDEIVGLLPTDPAQQDALIAEFYQRLLAAAPGVKSLFPPDLVDGDALNSQGHRQRDELLNALVEILTKFDPDNPESTTMQELERNAEKWGRSHANFQRPDGSYGATPDEYRAVRDTLWRLLVDAGGDKWDQGHTRALLAAYHDVQTIMMYAARQWLKERRGSLHPRLARPGPGQQAAIDAEAAQRRARIEAAQ